MSAPPPPPPPPEPPIEVVAPPPLPPPPPPAAPKAKPIPPLIKPVYKPPPVLPKGDTWSPPPVPHKVPPNLTGSVPHKVPPGPPKAKAEAEVVDLEDPKAAAPEPSQPASEPSQPSQPPQQKARPRPQPPKGPPECLREQWEEAQQRQAADTAAASNAVVAAKSAAPSTEEVPPFTVPDSYQGDPEERRHIICRFQGLRPLEEFCVCIDFHNVLDLGNGGRFLAVDQRTVGALRDLLVDCAPARLPFCSFKTNFERRSPPPQYVSRPSSASKGRAKGVKSTHCRP